MTSILEDQPEHGAMGTERAWIVLCCAELSGGCSDADKSVMVPSSQWRHNLTQASVWTMINGGSVA